MGPLSTILFQTVPIIDVILVFHNLWKRPVLMVFDLLVDLIGLIYLKKALNLQ